MSSNVVWVQMTISISGGRADGRNWPERWGEAIDLPADEAWPLIRAGNAVEVPAPKRAAAPLPPPASVTPAPVSDPAATARGPVAESTWGLTGPSVRAGSGDGTVSFSPGGVVSSSDDDSVLALVTPGEHISSAGGDTDEPVPVRERPDFSAEELVPPKPAAPKQEWVEYAMARDGISEDDAQQQTKAQLMQKYGGRL